MKPRKRNGKARKASKVKKAQPDLVYELGRRSVSISKGLINPEAEPEVSFGPEDIGIDFNMHFFKAILKGALLDKDTDKIIIKLPKANAKKLFESYMKRHFAHLQAEVEKSDTMDELLEVAERVRNTKITITEEAFELFCQEKDKLLRQVEGKFGGTVKMA